MNKQLLNKKILENFQAKPIPQKHSAVYIEFGDPDIIFVKDKREDYKDTTYETLLNTFKYAVVSQKVKSTKEVSPNILKNLTKRSNGEDANTYKYIRKVDNLFITINSPAKYFASPNVNPVNVIVEGDIINIKNLPKYSKKQTLKIPEYGHMSYYLNNREVFINFINKFFKNNTDYKEAEELSLSCNSPGKQEFSVLVHQKIVRDYMNLFTPYRGILLYHGLGSGKTCSSIAIAEGFKHIKQIVVMTPKSLLRNYVEELKNCGDPIYKTNYFWTFKSIYQTPDVDLKSDKDDDVYGINMTLVRQLISELGLTEGYILNKKGAWIPDSTIKPNFNELTIAEQNAILQQITHMIHSKYNLVAYNGLRKDNINHKLRTFDGTTNPFDDKVVIIDEAHNFVSRIINKLSSKKHTNSVPIILYNWLLDAQNCRVVFLTGTPIVNSPSELSVLFNILRGNIREWTLTIETKHSEKIDVTYFKKLFNKSPLFDDPDQENQIKIGDVIDNIEYKPSTHVLKFTRTPQGFANKYKKRTYMGVAFAEGSQIGDADLFSKIHKLLESKKFIIKKENIQFNKFTAFPHNEDFMEMFVNEKTRAMKNADLFKRRIAGLSSFFKSPQEKLMPKYEINRDFFVVKCEMSKYQLSVYEGVRAAERQEDIRNAKKAKRGLYDDVNESTSTYRIYSRSFCNYVFPEAIPRPVPSKRGDERIEPANSKDDDMLEDLGDIDILMDKTQQTLIREALNTLKEKSSELLIPDALEIYSPKFKKMLEYIQNPLHKGLHLVYSNFKTLEGIGIFKLVLLQNGFVEFKISKNKSNLWTIDMEEDDIGKPAFVSYTGDEDDDVKEIYRNIYSNLWDNIPITISEYLRKYASGNIYGDIIKVFMITASGAEGISLKNGRYVHIMEPYWHPVRIKQVIGRVRRICSHEELPPDERNIKVFMYLSTFSEQQKKDGLSSELMLKDRSAIDKKTILTTDEYIYEKSNLKEQITNQFVTALKESAIDCTMHKNPQDKSYTCYSFINPNSSKFLYAPSIKDDPVDDIRKENETVKKIKMKGVEIDGKLYAITDDYKLFDYQSYIEALQNPGQMPNYIGFLDEENKEIIYD